MMPTNSSWNNNWHCDTQNYSPVYRAQTFPANNWPEVWKQEEFHLGIHSSPLSWCFDPECCLLGVWETIPPWCPLERGESKIVFVIITEFDQPYHHHSSLIPHASSNHWKIFTVIIHPLRKKPESLENIELKAVTKIWKWLKKILKLSNSIHKFSVLGWYCSIEDKSRVEIYTNKHTIQKYWWWKLTNGALLLQK